MPDGALHIFFLFRLIQAAKHLTHCHVGVIGPKYSSIVVFVVAETRLVSKGLGECFAIP
jgi:hypothetical protein